MTNQPTPALATKDEKLENAVEDIYRFAAKLKQNKENDEQIQKRLTDAGLSSEAARMITQLGLTRLGQDKRAGPRKLLFGALWLAVGILMLATFNPASLGGIYWIAYGAILLGLLQLVFGLIQLLRAPRGKVEVQNIVQRITPTIKAEETIRWKIAAIKIHNP